MAQRKRLPYWAINLVELAMSQALDLEREAKRLALDPADRAASLEVYGSARSLKSTLLQLVEQHEDSTQGRTANG